MNVRNERLLFDVEGNDGVVYFVEIYRDSHLVHVERTLDGAYAEVESSSSDMLVLVHEAILLVEKVSTGSVDLKTVYDEYPF